MTKRLNVTIRKNDFYRERRMKGETGHLQLHMVHARTNPTEFNSYLFFLEIGIYTHCVSDSRLFTYLFRKEVNFHLRKGGR